MHRVVEMSDVILELYRLLSNLVQYWVIQFAGFEWIRPLCLTPPC
jgi:hypothetical protein